MQIKETAKIGYIQIVNNVYSAEKKRSVSVSVGSMSIFKPVPAALWEKLDADEQAKLMAYVAKKLAALNLGALQAFAESLPGRLIDLSEAWPALAENVGHERAAALVGEIEFGFKRLKKTMAAQIRETSPAQ